MPNEITCKGQDGNIFGNCFIGKKFNRTARLKTGKMTHDKDSVVDALYATFSAKAFTPSAAGNVAGWWLMAKSFLWYCPLQKGVALVKATNPPGGQPC